MIRRVWWWVAAFVFCPYGEAVAQWQPLFGEGGVVQGSPPSTPSVPSPAPPTPSRGTGWMPLDTGAPPPAAAPVGAAPSVSPAPSAPPPAAGGAPGRGGVEIRYTGQAAADPRTAAMVLTLSGTRATADVHIDGVCQQNVHLGGADLTLTGTLSGPWEGKTSSIDGSWKGTDHFCGSDEPNEGQFKYFLKQESGTLHLRITGKRGQYGWDFKPTGRVYTTAEPPHGGDLIGGPTGFESPLGRPGSGYRTGAGVPQAYNAAPADRLRELFTAGTITLQVGDSHLQTLPPRESVRTVLDPSSGRTGTSSDPCVKTGSNTVYMDPSSIADVAPAGSAFKVTARAKGKGELWIGGIDRCTGADGSQYNVRTIIIYIVLVGDEAIADYRRQQGRNDPLPPAPPGDIAQARVTGRAVLKGIGEAVDNAMVTLVTKEGGSIRRDAWKTRNDGTFDVAAESLMSGRYEVVVQKLGYGPVPGKCQADPAEPPGIGVACDLWPVDKVYVTLSRDSPSANAGVIALDFLRNFDWYGAKAQKLRDVTGQPARPRFQ